MDFQVIGEETIKIKSKRATFVVDPKEKISKLEADGVLVTQKPADITRVNDYRVAIDGPGEYEVSGLKVSGINADGSCVYELISDGSSILLARASSLSKISQDKLDEYKIVVINADSELNQSMITAMEPRVVLLYGSQSREGAKKLDSNSTSVSGKVSVSEDKLPDELEVMLLG